MEEIKLLSNKKEELYSGRESGFYAFKTQINLNDNDYKTDFSVAEQDSALYELQPFLPKELILNIADKSTLKKYDFEKQQYFGQWELTVEYIYKSPYLILISLGEAHRGTFKVYKEAVWYAPNLPIPAASPISQDSEK